MRTHSIKKQEQDGFTLIEVVVVIGITAILMAMSLGYNRNSERQIVLFSEQAKVAGVLERAKTLALARYKEGSADFCGFGVYFDIDKDPNALIIFGDNPKSCGNYDASGENSDKIIESQPIDGRLEFNLADGKRGSVIFKPPYGEAMAGGLFVLPAKIVLRDKKTNGEAGVEVSSGGGVTMK